jgi:hypothetical protein
MVQRPPKLGLELVAVYHVLYSPCFVS